VKSLITTAVVVSAGFMTACDKHSGYEDFGGGLYMKRISFDEEGSQEPCEKLLEVRGQYFFEGEEMNNRLFFKNEAGFDTIETTMLPEPFKRAAMILNKGDSVHLIIDADESGMLKDILPKGGKGKFEIRWKVVQTEALPLSERRKKEKEEEALMRYLSNSGKKWEAHPSGIFINWIEKTEQSPPGTADKVDLLYTGRFLNGRIFDDAGRRGQYFEYIPGTQNQLIRGLEIAVSIMPVGSRAEIIVPWNLAFGEEGSSTGIVGPFKMVIFDLQLRNHTENNI